MARETNPNPNPKDPPALPPEPNQEIEALKADNAKLSEQIAVLSAQLKQVLGNRAPTKAELKVAREAKEKAKREAMAKRDAEAKETVVIQKFNRDGDLTRERTCAEVDINTYLRQGYKVKKD